MTQQESKQNLIALIQSGMIPSKREIEKGNALFKICKEHAKKQSTQFSSWLWDNRFIKCDHIDEPYTWYDHKTKKHYTPNDVYEQFLKQQK